MVTRRGSQRTVRFDSADDYAAHNVFANTAALSPLRVRVDCGTDDGFLNAARDFAAKLPTVNLGSFTDGRGESR